MSEKKKSIIITASKAQNRKRDNNPSEERRSVKWSVKMLPTKRYGKGNIRPCIFSRYIRILKSDYNTIYLS